MALERFVDAMDDWLVDNIHAALSPRSSFSGVTSARRSYDDRGLAEHRSAREELRAAAAGVLFVRNKLEAEQTERRVRMARACHAILRAARDDDDATALPLLAYRDVLRRRIREAEEELAGLRTQAADAKDALARLTRAIDRIEASRQRRRGPRRLGGVR